MKIEVVRHFEDADSDSLKIELFCDCDLIVRAWYIGPLIRIAEELVLPFTPREQNVRAETAIARVVEIALVADLPVTLIDPLQLWDELWDGHKGKNRAAALHEDRTLLRRHLQIAVRDSRAAKPRRGLGRDVQH